MSKFTDNNTLADIAIEPESSQDLIERRAGYFMLFRVGVLSTFALLAGLSGYLRRIDSVNDSEWVTWSAIAFIYGLTILLGWGLHRLTRLHRFIWLQTAVDIVLAAIVVQLSGGADSGFTFMYLIAILSAAATGDRKLTWTTAGTCAFIYGSMTSLQALELVLPLAPSGEAVYLEFTPLSLAAARTLAGIVAVSLLSSYLNHQWLASVHQVGNLRALNDNIVNSLTSGLITVDTHQKILYGNPTAFGLLGASDSNLGQHIDEILPGTSRYLNAPTGFGGRFEIDMINSDRAPIHLGLSCCSLHDDEGKQIGHVIHFQDVSELRKLEHKLLRSERLAAIGRLSATVAHEVRNPLAAIVGCAELLTSANLGSEDHRLLSVIRRESQKLNRTVANLLEYSRPRAPEISETDCSRATHEIIEAYRVDPNNSNMEIEFSAPGPLFAMVDPIQFSQALWNLLRNATEAQKNQGKIFVELKSTTNFVIVSVRDEGPGIPENAFEQIFEPFYTTKSEGSGFGLAWVYRVMEDHDGSISVSSNDGSGATFSLHWPRSPNSTKQNTGLHSGAA